MKKLSRLSRGWRISLAALAGLLAVAVVAGIYALVWFQRNVPELHASIEDHFKYGSIGAEGRSGIPYWIWRVLPTVFPERLPPGPGEGYARLGFIYESPAHQRPIGTSYREKPFPMVGLNCSLCHSSLVQESPGAPAQLVLGMPAGQFNLAGYLGFLFASARDPRFTAGTLLPAIRAANPDFSWLDGLIYRYLIIPRTKDALLQEAANFSWMEARPPLGPGRVDTFNPYKRLLGMDLAGDDTVGTADLPSLWNQRARANMWLHWDGNNNSVEERNKSAAIGAGASPASLDLAGMKRIEDWILDLPPPRFPAARIDQGRAQAGERLFQTNCAQCHALDGRDVGQVTPLSAVGTDPERLRSFSPELAQRMNTLGTGYPWKFSHFRTTGGYANMPLDGIWLRAPYLHNGSVPTLRDLLKPPEERPKAFYRGYPVYNFADVGFQSAGAEAERLGWRYDTTARGNSNGGHTYGTNLATEEKEAILEYLKTQ